MQFAGSVTYMFSQYVGQQATIVHLQGAPQYNGLRCRIVGYDTVSADLSSPHGGCVRLKVQVTVDGAPKMLRVRMRNLDKFKRDGAHQMEGATPNLYTGDNVEPASRDEILAAARLVVQHHDENHGERRDMEYRFRILRDWVAAVDAATAAASSSGDAGEAKQTQGTPPTLPPISCQVRHDTPFDQMPPLMRIMDTTQAACRGDGTVDFARNMEGLRPAPSATCCICLEPLSSSSSSSSSEDTGLVLLPCNHMFHRNCVAGWFAREANAGRSRVECPECRGPNHLPVDAYMLDPKRRFVERIFEWVQSGMCVVCQSNFVETNAARFVRGGGGAQMVGAPIAVGPEANGTEAPGQRTYGSFGPTSSLVPGE